MSKMQGGGGITRADASSTYALLVPPPTGVAATDYANILATYTALPSTGGILRLQAGTYALGTNTLTFTKRVTLEGCGSADIYWRNVGSLITSTSTTSDLITLAAHGCIVRNLTLDNLAVSAPTAGSGIKVTVGDGFRIESVSARGFWINIDVYDGAEWWITNCNIYGPVKYGIRVAHTDLPDGGDGTISGCQIIAAAPYNAPDAGLYWVSSGGLRLANNKFNGRGTAKFLDGARYDTGAGVATGSLLLTGNSIENWSRHGLYMTSPSVGTLSGIVITGNEFASSGATNSSIHIDGSAGGAVSSVVITGNILACPVSGIGAVKLNTTVGVHMAGNKSYQGNLLTTRIGTNVGFRLEDRTFPVRGVGPNTNTATGTAGVFADLMTVTLQDVAVGDLLKMEFDATLFGTAVGDSMYVQFMIGATAVNQQMAIVTFPTAAAWVPVHRTVYWTVDNASDVVADICTVKVQIAKGGGTQGNVYGSTSYSRSAFAVTNLYNGSTG